MASTSFGQAFVFKLTGHQTSRFVLCLPLNKLFLYENYGVEIQTSYCICIISRFAFFSYFMFSLQQFVELGGLDFETPLEKQDIGFPIQSTLKYLNDMGTKMFRVLCPLYPIDTIHPNSASSGDTEFSSPQVHRKMDHSKMLPSVEFQFSVKSAVAGQPSRKVDMIMRRDLELKYFYSGGMQPTVNSDTCGSHKDAAKSQLENKMENERIWDREESFHVLLWALPVLLRKLPLDQISLAIGCALIEMHVIVLSPDLSVMSACLLGIVHLLRPLKWVGVVVVTLPESQHEYLDSPVPLIAGVQKLPANFALMPGVVVVDCSENCVKFHPTDNVTSHKFFLPQTNKLIHNLAKSAETIYYRSPARKPTSALSRKKSIANVSSLAADAASGAPDSPERQLLPTPVDMDPSDKGQALMGAVSDFSNIVAAHLQVLVNTAVQSAWEVKQQKYKKRELLLTKALSPQNMIGKQLSNTIFATRSNSTSMVPSPSDPRRQSFAVRTVHASVATAAATMRLNTKNWTNNLSAAMAGAGSGSSADSVQGGSSVVSSQHDSNGSDSSESLPSIQKVKIFNVCILAYCFLHPSDVSFIRAWTGSGAVSS
jgi:hypothetical protein